MAERNIPPCPTHGSNPRALHEHNFFGIITVVENIIDSVSGVGTRSFSRCPYGYPANFEGVVRVLEDLNTSISGIETGGGGIGGSGLAAGSGIYITSSGDVDFINVDTQFIYDTVISGNFIGEGIVDVSFSGISVIISGQEVELPTNIIVSGSPGENYTNGDLWFDTNEGRLFVYASGGDTPDAGWYQTNAEALANIGPYPPSGNGLNAPPRDGSLWFSSLEGELFIYDEGSESWYATTPNAVAISSPIQPLPDRDGALWLKSDDNSLLVFNDGEWVTPSGVG